MGVLSARLSVWIKIFYIITRLLNILRSVNTSFSLSCSGTVLLFLFFKHSELLAYILTTSLSADSNLLLILVRYSATRGAAVTAEICLLQSEQALRGLGEAAMIESILFSCSEKS